MNNFKRDMFNAFLRNLDINSQGWTPGLDNTSDCIKLSKPLVYTDVIIYYNIFRNRFVHRIVCK